MAQIDVKVKILDENATMPLYAHVGDSGADLYSAEELRIHPMSRCLVRTGIAMDIPKGYEGCIRPRSGNALKQGYTILNSPGTVDSNYRGEISVLIFNTSNTPVHIKKGDRIAQIVFQQVPSVKLVAVDELDNTDRGNDGFGSTGR